VSSPEHGQATSWGIWLALGTELQSWATPVGDALDQYSVELSALGDALGTEAPVSSPEDGWRRAGLLLGNPLGPALGANQGDEGLHQATHRFTALAESWGPH
jgi:hypothetical protein